MADLNVKYYRANPNIIRDTKRIKPFYMNSMKISILETGDNAFKEMLIALQNYKFVNLVIDISTINNTRIVHTTLANPYNRLTPLPFQSVKK